MDIHPIRHGYSTVFLITAGEDAMLVDTSTTGAERAVSAELERLGVGLRLVVLTHFHYDHVGSAEAIRAATGARIAIHRRDAAALRRGGHLALKPTGAMGRLLSLGIKRIDQPGIEPDLELDDDDDLTRHGGFGRAVATPGHTPGSVSVVLDDGSVFAGDAFTRGPVTRRVGPPMFVDDAEAARRSNRSIAAITSRLHVAHFGDGDVSKKALDRYVTNLH